MRYIFGAMSVFVLLSVWGQTATATHDSGSSYKVLRWSLDGQNLMVLEEDSQGTFSTIHIYVGADPKPVLSVSPEEWEYEFTDSEDEENKEPEELVALCKKYSLTEKPIKRELSPLGDRFVGVFEKEKKSIVFLIEGETKITLKNFKRISYSPTCTQIELNVYWHSTGNQVVLAGSYVTEFGDAVVSWEPVLIRKFFTEEPKKKLSKRFIAQEFNKQGLYYYKIDQKSEKFDLESYRPVDFYRKAVEWDPEYETAIYNLACMLSVDGRSDDMIETLEKLKALGTPEALKLLKGAQSDSDFSKMIEDPEFKRLTN